MAKSNVVWGLLGLVLVLPCTVLGLTYTSPLTTDGVVESATPVLGGTEWETDELVETDGGTDFYITWDDTTVYCAITGTYADQEDGDYDWFIAFDVDMVAGSGATNDGYSHVTFSGNFLPEYIYYFAGGMGWYESSEWDGSQWVWRGWSNTCSYGGWDNNKVSEICIPRSMIGTPDSFAVVSWISTEDNSMIVASFPKANPIGTSPQGMTYFFVAGDLGEGVSPASLPVEPTPPSATVDNERSYPHTCTVMADITPGNCGSTTSMRFYYTFDGSTPDTTSPFVEGVFDTCTVGGDTTDTFYAVLSSVPDDSTVKWIARGVAANGLVDVSDVVQSFVQGGTAWLGNEGSSPTDCTVWAEIYVGDGGASSWMKFAYTTDGTDPRTSATVDTVDGVFDVKLGNNDKFYAILTAPSPGDTVAWYAFGRDAYNNYAESDTFFTFVQADTADIYNLNCYPDSNYVEGEVAPKGYGAGINFIWTTDGSDPRTSETAHTAVGFWLRDTDTTGVFAAYLTAEVGDTIKWYAHAWGSDNSYSDSPLQTCVAGVTSGPTLCNLTCDPESLFVTASISPRGYGCEIDFIYTHDGSDPKTSPTAYTIHGSFLREEDPSGECTEPVAVFGAQLYALQGETIKWYAHGWYQPFHRYNGLFGDSPVQTCVADTTVTGVRRITGEVVTSAVPNPFASSVRISFVLPSRSPVELTIYDIRGRMVQKLIDGVLPAGEQIIKWDGRNSKGEQLPSGVYFYRLRAGGYETTRKLVLVK